MHSKIPHSSYTVTEDGTIYNKNNEIVQPYLNKSGYLRVNLRINNKYQKFYIHRLVAQAFLPNRNNLPEVNHKNGIKTDNRFMNLEWTTSSKNEVHYYFKLDKPKPQSYFELLNHYDLLVWKKYHFFSNGVIYSDLTGKFLKPTKNSNDYFYYRLRFDTKQLIVISLNAILDKWNFLETILNKKAKRYA